MSESSIHVAAAVAHSSRSRAQSRITYSLFMWKLTKDVCSDGAVAVIKAQMCDFY